MRERTLETHKPSYVPREAKPFFIPVVHSPLGAVGDVVAQSSPLGETEPRAMGQMEASEPTSVGKRGLELRDTWQHRNSPQ
jgi:hypothetical protein